MVYYTHTGWLCYDDEKVYKVKDEKVVDKNAYILLYSRREHLTTDNKL